MTYRAVIFDLFGTLAGFSVSRYRDELARMAAVLGAPVYEFTQLWDQIIGQPGTVEEQVETVLRTLGVFTHLDQRIAAVDIICDFVRATLAPQPGAIDLLAALRARGVKAGLISNCEPIVARFWPKTELAPWIDAAIFSYDVAIRKPDARIYALACERLLLPPKSCLYLGDGSHTELTGAAAAGLTPVQIVPDGEHPDDARYFSREAWRGARIASLNEVLDLLAT
jgi:putative hydrolase of the HAD superfamily